MPPDTVLYGVVAVPAIIGLTQVAKELGVPGRMAPLAAVLLGVLFAMAELYKDRWPWVQAVVVGVGLGLSAAGLYSGALAVTSQSQVTSRKSQDSTATNPPG